MDAASAFSLMAGESFELERDMRPSPCIQMGSKVSVQDYVEGIAARHPLLGAAVLENSYRDTVETTALDAIYTMLGQNQVNNWASLAVLLTIIQYAKNWERAENAGFWEYITEQLGYRYSQRVYKVLTNAVRVACQNYGRLFIVDQKGDNRYYSTVLAHAMAPKKSVFALFDFLAKFYYNNLDCSVYEDDPAISRMIGVLQDRCNGASVEQDDDISGHVYGIQAGLRVLLLTRPGYMKYFITKILYKMESMLNGLDLLDAEHIDTLLTQWHAEKTIEAVSQQNSPASFSMSKRAVPAHKRTTDIALSYIRIKAEYVLENNNEPALRISSIRLERRENPVLRIFSLGRKIYEYTISIYGNDYSATSDEVIVPLSDLADTDFRNLEVEIQIENEIIFSSRSSLNAEVLVFKGDKLHVSKTLDEGNYTLFAPKQVRLEFQGSIEYQLLSYFAQLYNIYIQGEAFIFADGSLLCSSRPHEGSLRFQLPQTQTVYVLGETTYPIYSRNEFAITAVGKMDSENVGILLQSGEQLEIEDSDCNHWYFNSPCKNGNYHLTLFDRGTGRIFDETRFYIANNCIVRFDSSHYLETSEGGNVTLDIDGEHFELSLMGHGAKVKIPYGEGEIHIPIPRVKIFLDGKSLPNKAIWKDEISPSSQIRVLCPDSLNTTLVFGGTQIARRNALGGYDFSIGNAVQAYDGSDSIVPIILLLNNNKIRIIDIVFNPLLARRPKFSLSKNILIWLNCHTFVGERNTTFKLIFQPKNEEPIVLYSRQGEKILSKNFPGKSERYQYWIFAQNETAFGVSEILLDDGHVIFGEREAVIFRGETLRIDSILLDRKVIEIKPIYAADIKFVGVENLGYSDLSGDYAHYTATLFFKTKSGCRYFKNFNPVDIYLINENSRILHISYCDGDGLLIDKRDDYKAQLYEHRDPPKKLASCFFFPDFYEFNT